MLGTAIPNDDVKRRPDVFNLTIRDVHDQPTALASFHHVEAQRSILQIDSINLPVGASRPLCPAFVDGFEGGSRRSGHEHPRNA